MSAGVGAAPRWTLIAPLAALALFGAIAGGTIDGHAPVALVGAGALLGAAVFAAIHHADVVALRIGQPFGAIVLAISVTVIEVSLIVSIMLTTPDAATQVARDTVFASVMIVLNGVVGLCLLIGGIHHHEQGFQSRGAGGALSVIGTLATLALILPNFTVAAPGPTYSPPQLVFVGIVSLVLYGLFLFVQTVLHRDQFIDGPTAPEASGVETHGHETPSTGAAALSGIFLLLALVAVSLLAEDLSPTVHDGVARAGLPTSFVGVIIAAVVLLPEGLSAIHAARANRLQTGLNLALGSAMASIGLTIPTVAFVSLAIGLPLDLGIDAEHMVLLVLTLFASTLTIATGRTTVLQGGVHLVIFGAFLTIAAVP